MLPRVYRSQMSHTTTNYTTTQMLPRIYRSQMSQATTTYNRKTQMLPRIYRSQVPADYTETIHASLVLSWYNGSKVPYTNTSYHNKTTGNILTSNYAANAVLPWIHRSQMSQTTDNIY